MKKAGLLYEGLFVKRYHTVRTITQDTVGRHSCGVVLLCAELAGSDCTPALLIAAAMHDLAEYWVGDIPSPVKRIKHIRDEILAQENLVHSVVGWHIPPLSDKEVRILDLADKLEGLLFCRAEIKQGNGHLVDVANRYEEYIMSMNPTTVELELMKELGGI